MVHDGSRGAVVEGFMLTEKVGLLEIVHVDEADGNTDAGYQAQAENDGQAGLGFEGQLEPPHDGDREQHVRHVDQQAPRTVHDGHNLHRLARHTASLPCRVPEALHRHAL